MTNRGDQGTLEWELSKENVQPLRTGRKVANLTAALHPLSGDQLSKIKEQRQTFELELRTYTGDDPLDVWYRYIKWTEQTYPKGGKDGHMVALLENCVAAFKDEPKYKNDQRYLEAWIKFANSATDPLEAYTFLYDQAIGCELACFYEAWTWQLEQLGNTKKADAIYQEGIRRLAYPSDRLERSYKEFQARVVRQAAEDLDDGPPQEPQVEERVAFGQLKGRGKYQTVGSVRTGHARREGPAGGMSVKVQSQQQSGQAFQVFCDENQPPPGSVPPQTGEWIAIPTRSETNRENEQKPGVWTKGRVPQRTTGVIPISSVSSYNTPTFTVHTDEQTSQELRTPMKHPEVGNQVLSARKPGREKNPLEHISQMTVCDSSQRPMYRKDLVYTGVEEFSFEEIRAARWTAKRKERMIIEQGRAFHNEVLLLRQEMQKIQEHNLQLEQTQAQLLSHIQFGQGVCGRPGENGVSQSFNSSQRSTPDSDLHQSLDSLHLEQSCNINDSRRRPGPIPPSSVSNSANAHFHPYRSSISESTVTKQLAFDDFTFHSNDKQGASAGLPPLPDTVQCKSVEKDPLTANTSLNNNTMHTPSMNGSLHNNTHTSSGKSLGHSLTSNPTPDSVGSVGRPCRSTPTRQSIAPSPTVNTKEAYQVVMGMFNDPLEMEKHLGWSQHGEETEHMDTNHQVAPVVSGGLFSGSSAPFQIFDENTYAKSAAVKKDENDENRPPSGYNNPPKRKGLSGILQPATDIPFMATEESEDSHRQEDHMDGVEMSQYPCRDDITLAPLGSQLDFTAAARLASTPFNPNSDKGDTTQLSSIRPPQTSARKISMGHDSIVAGDRTTAPTLHSDVESYNDGAISATEKVGLSPIMELSDEDQKTCSNNASHHHGNSTAHHTSHIEMTKQVVQERLLPASDGRSRSKSPDNQSYHVIDTSGYVAPESDDKTIALLSMSIAIDPRNPFDEMAIQGFLDSLDTPISSYPNYFSIHGPMPEPKAGHAINLGDDMYTVEKELGRGGFATIFLIQKIDYDEMTFGENGEVCGEVSVMKIQKPPCPWEFYISTQIHQRLAKLNGAVNVAPSIMSIKEAFFFDDYSCLVNELHTSGTLLDLVNVYRHNVLADMEPFAMYITIELLHILEQLHQCEIIHGDIKPDNFLIREIPSKMMGGSEQAGVFGGKTRMLKLIDFGQSIDMTMYQPGTTFMAKVDTSGFQCIEMKTDKPWTYQTDLFGLIGTIHVVIFGEYMNIYQTASKWKITSSFPRKWNVLLWKTMFEDLLNIASCSDLPADLPGYRRQFEQYFVENLSSKYSEISRKIILELEQY